MHCHAPAALALWLACASAVTWAQAVHDEKVVVTASAYPVAFDNLARTVTVFTRADIARMPVRSITDVLAWAASVDVHSRAPMGLQADISVRASAFSQVLILLDGVRVNDSQSAHHNADFPVLLDDVERIEILCGPGSALYGADALGGIINIITRRSGDHLRTSISAGQNGLVAAAVGLNLRKGIVAQRVNAAIDSSSGFAYDRDFRNLSMSARTSIGGRSSVYVAHVNKEFGADGFYGPAPSREWTNQTLVSFEQRLSGKADSKAMLQSYYRTHGDRFLYDQRTPGIYENRHRTHAVGAVVKSGWSLAKGVALSLGGEAGGDFIASSNLGSQAFGRMSVFGELQWSLGKSAVAYAGMRYDYYSRFGSAASPSVSGSWWLHPRVRLRASIARAFRIPTFTELYYRDPNNEANPRLKPESAWSAEAGADVVPAKNWLGSFSVFSRREHDVIDWIRRSPAEKWSTANIRRLGTTGMEISLERSFSSQARLALRYALMESSPGPIDFISKYVLDYARHSWTASGSMMLPFAISYGQTVSYRQRADGRSWWLLDARLQRRFGELTAAVDFTNLLNVHYREITGVDAPGRWITLSLAIALPESIR